MNKTLLLAGVAAFLFTTNTNATEFNPYVGAKIKYIDMSADISEDDSFDVDDKVAGASFSIGASVATEAGALRAELEYNKNGNNKKSYLVTDGVDDFNAKFKVETQAIMLNGYYDINTNSKLTPFISAGIGYAKVKTSLYLDGEKQGSIDKNNFAWQLGFGAGYAVSNNVTIDAGYRYIDYGDFTDDETKVEASAHELYVGARYAF